MSHSKRLVNFREITPVQCGQMIVDAEIKMRVKIKEFEVYRFLNEKEKKGGCPKCVLFEDSNIFLRLLNSIH